MVFDFIKRLFSGNNTQIDSIIMTDSKDLDYSSANGNSILLNLLSSDNPLQNYSTNGLVRIPFPEQC